MSGRRLALAAGATVAAVAVAVLVWGSGLDRMSRGTPALAPMIPEPLRSLSWRTQAAKALQQERPDRALVLAHRAVIADPGNPASLSLLGGSRYATGDGGGAASAFRVAAALGWRDEATQVYWLSAALQNGAWDIAAPRLDALLRQKPYRNEAAFLLAPFEDAPEGRRALLDLLATRPPWLPAYLATLDQLAPERLEARARVLAQPQFRKARATCDEITPLVNALSTNNQVVTARDLWRDHCANGGKLLADGGFDRARLEPASVFEWQLLGTGGLDLRLDAMGGDRALTVSSTRSARTTFAAQALSLKPGAYRLSWSASDAAGQGSDRIVARLGCQRQSGDFLLARRVQGPRFAATVQITDQCPLQWLDLTLTPGSGAVTVDDLRLEPEGS